MYGAYKPGISQIWLENPYMENEIVGTIVVDPLDERYLIFSVDPDTLPQNTLDPVDSVINPQISGPNAGLPGPTPNKRYLIVEDISPDTTSWGPIIGSVTGKSTLPESLPITQAQQGERYMIASVGTTNFTALGAGSNSVGVIFTMNGSQPAGTGTVYKVVVANANDIVQYNADIGVWFIAFDSSEFPNDVEYVLNLTTQVQYRWAATPDVGNVAPDLEAQWMKSYEGYYNEGDYSIVI